MLLKKETIFSERVDGKFVLRRDFLIKKNQRVIGFLYVGTGEGKNKNIPDLDPKDFVTEWN